MLDWNAPTIRFYESIGAAPQSEWVRYRLVGDALRAFADGTPVDAAQTQNGRRMAPVRASRREGACVT